VGLGREVMVSVDEMDVMVAEDRVEKTDDRSAGSYGE
jgi:hypothetical protein